MIREALQRPGRLRMRLTVVAAASALFALVVLAALVLPSLQHNLEQSRVASLRASVRGERPPELLLQPFGRRARPPRGAPEPRGDARRGAHHGLHESTGFSCDRSPTRLERAARPQGARARARRRAILHRDVSTVDAPARRAHGRAHVLRLEPGSGRRRARRRRRCATSSSRSRRSSAASCSAASLAFAVALLAGALAAEPLARRLARLRAAAERIARGSFGEPIVDHKRDEIGELARSLDEMRSASMRSSARARAFIANASHELRTPLTALGGYLELLTEGGLTEAERERVPRDDGRAGAAPDEAGDGPARPLAARRRRLHGRARRARARRARGRLRRARCRRSPRAAGRPSSRSRESRRSRAATRGGCCRCCACSWTTPCATRRRAPRSRCAPRRRPGAPASSSRTTGPGIPPELLERVFERFFRGPGAAARGTGLGLAIARELAERMDGRLLATSSPAGTRFTLELPGPCRRGHARLHWESVTTRAALASAVIIALVAGIAGGALALALRGGGGERTTVTTVVRSGGPAGSRAASTRSRSTPARATASSRSRRTFGVDDAEGGSGFVVNARARPDRDRLARRRAARRPAARLPTKATAVYVVLDDGTRADATLLGYDLFEDTALLQVDPAHLGLRALPLGHARSLRVGDPVAVIGSPFENRASLSTGVVSQLDRQITAPGVVLPDDRRDPDRRGRQPGQLGRPAAGRARRGRRHGHGDQPATRAAASPTPCPWRRCERPTGRSPPGGASTTPGWAWALRRSRRRSQTRSAST